MHVLTQLDPPMRVITPLGDAVAYFLWTFYVRIDRSITDTPHKTSPIALPPDMEAALVKHRKRYGRRT